MIFERKKEEALKPTGNGTGHTHTVTQYTWDSLTIYRIPTHSKGIASIERGERKREVETKLK